jgi:hypothetical protein
MNQKLSINNIFNQLPRLPPVFTGFLPAPPAFGLAINLEPPDAMGPFGFLAPPFPASLLFVGNDIASCLDKDREMVV